VGYFVDDIPAQPLVVDPLRNGEPIDLSLFDEVDASLYDPEGNVIEEEFLAEIVEDTIVVDWPEVSPFAFAGIYSLRLVVRGDGAREQLPVVRLVADEFDDGWYNLETAREDWRDAPAYDATLFTLLWSARGDVRAYAPMLEFGVRPPVHYRQAQLMQARNQWNAAKVDPANGGLGDESFIVTPHPLDWMIKQILRPATNVPVVG
jgi:hypothetical protein